MEEGHTSSLEELRKKIKDAFDVFDHESNKTVDVREIGTIVRSLNCCPTESELNEILKEIEEEDPTGYIRFEKFQPVMMKILLEKKYRPAPESHLLQAFKILDTDNKDHLTMDEIQKCMTEEGEPFTQEEMEEMFSAAVDPDKNLVFYKDFLFQMVVESS